MRGRSKVIDGLLSPKDAEAIGIREALSSLKGLGWDNMIVEMDALRVFKALHESVAPSSFNVII